MVLAIQADYLLCLGEIVKTDMISLGFDPDQVNNLIGFLHIVASKISGVISIMIDVPSTADVFIVYKAMQPYALIAGEQFSKEIEILMKAIKTASGNHGSMSVVKDLIEEAKKCEVIAAEAMDKIYFLAYSADESFPGRLAAMANFVLEAGELMGRASCIREALSRWL